VRRQTSFLRVRAVGIAVAIGTATVLAGCGGGSSATPATSGAAATGQASGSPSRTGGRFDAAEQAKIRQCLEAAGISVPTFTRPSNLPSGQRPTFPSGSARPSGGFGGEFADPKVQAALKACGITLPTRRPSGSPGAGAPTGSPTS
jgi:hypothetical protein